MRNPMQIVMLQLALTIVICAHHTELRAQIDSPLIIGYFPSWSETWTSQNQNSKLREIPSFVTHVFLAFAKPDLQYEPGSFDISQTGIEVPYDGCTLKESISALKLKGIDVILSVGGETYWYNPNVYDNINYQAIKNLVDDMGFAGIDWDYEPNGSFAEIGNAIYVQRYIDMISNSRAIMPFEEGYMIAAAPSGVGALGGQLNNDPDSPFSFQQRNNLTGETDMNLYQGTAVTNGINLFGFSATGHMIPVMHAVGNQLDFIAYQGYNCGGSQNRSIMYDAYAYYAELYGFKVAAGIHFPNEPWGPFYTYTHENVAALSSHLYEFPTRQGEHDGIMIWQMLLQGQESSAYSYLNLASDILNGLDVTASIQEALNFQMEPYTGGAVGCEGSSGGNLYCGTAAYNATSVYPTPGALVYYNCGIWQNLWWADPGNLPGENPVWIFVENCENTPMISITSAKSVFCISDEIEIQANISQSTEGIEVGYQWFVNNAPAPSNASTFYSTLLANGDVVYCIVSMETPCSSQSSFMSNELLISIQEVFVPSLSVENFCGYSVVTAEGEDVMWENGELGNVLQINTPGLIGAYQLANGCASELQFVYADPLPFPLVTIDELENTCLMDSQTLLVNGNPVGGEYSGNGVNNGYFDPSLAGLGEWMIYYSYQNHFGCSSTAETSILVEDCSNMEEVKNEWTIFPNPMDQFGMIKGVRDASNLNAVDGTGRVIYEINGRPLDDHELLPCLNWPSGIYTVSFLRDERRHAQKIFIFHK